MSETPDVVLRGSFSSSDERRYTHVPFTVPPGVGTVHVAYAYSDRIHSDPRLRDGNTLDIGLFDPRGIAPSSPGFRGWSGSHKDAFTLSEGWATPPYIAGPILPGTWHVLLGPYKVGPRGCAYEVAITFSAETNAPDGPGSSRVELPRPKLAAAEAGWLRGDLHCHTVFSDGDSWPAEMLAEAVARGLDFLGVTDHNQISHHAAYASIQGSQLPIILPGIEVTTYGGHWNAWGTDTWWEFREPTEAATTRAMQDAAASGALVSVNHPKPFGPAWEYPSATGFHAVEVWNGGWAEHNDVSLAWWEGLLREDRRIVALGGSDTHHLKRTSGDHLGRPTTWAHVEDKSVQGVIAALRAGRVFVSRGVDGPQLYVRASEVRVVDARGATLTLHSPRGVVHSETIGTNDWTTTLPRVEEAYVRTEVRHPEGEMLALSNPVWSASPSASAASS